MAIFVGDRPTQPNATEVIAAVIKKPGVVPGFNERPSRF
jgi:hypothetical protein